MRHENKTEFVAKLEELVKLAKPHIIKLEYVKASPSGEEYVNAYTENFARYQICVTADSELTIALDVINKLIFK